MNKKIQYWIFFLGIVALTCIPAVLPLFQPGFFLTQDADTLIIRSAEFHRMLRDGQFPVRYGTIINHAWGYPAFTFLYPLPMMTMEAFHLLGLGVIDSTKAWLIVATILSAIGMFLWMKSWFGTKAALPSAILFTYAPYRFLDLYVRGSIGELTALVFPPYIAWGIARFALCGKFRYFLVASIGWALLILAHNTLAFLFSFFLLFWLVWAGWKSNFRKLLSLIPVVAIVLTTWFWLPIAVEAKYVQFNPVSVFRDHYIYPIQLVWSYNLPLSWGYEGSGIGTQHDRMSFQLGIVPWLAIILALFSKVRVTRMLLAAVGASLFLMLPWSDPLWRMTHIEDFFQFPLRILSMGIFLASALWGIVLAKKPWWMIIAASMFSVFVTLPYARIGHYHDIPATDAFYETNDSTTTITDEFMPRVVKDKLPPRVYQEVEVVEGIGSIHVYKEKSNDIRVRVHGDTPLILRINTIDYPGWEALVDGRKVPIHAEPRWGFIQVPIAQGIHDVAVRFGETWWRLLGDYVSVSALAVLVFVSIKWSKTF